MAVVQGSLAKIEDIIKEDVEPVSDSLHQGYSRPESATSIHAKDKIVDVAIQALDEQARIDQGRQMDMAPFALYHPATLVEEWSQLESSTTFSVLCTFGICALYTGQFDAEFSTRAFIESLRNEKELQERVGILGKHRLGLSEGLVSSFVFFNRRMTLSTATSSAPLKPTKGLVELTGAPMFLTCALVVDACKLFLEGAAFVLITYTALQHNYDARLLSMVQAAQRLDEFDGNQYEQQEEEADRDRQENTSNQQPTQPLSICQIAAKFIKEVVETLQKWKLASSIYRKTRFSPAMNLKKPFGESSPSSWMRESASASPATTNCSTEDGSTDGNSTPPVVVHPPRPGDGYAHHPLLTTQRHPATDMVTASMEHLHTGTGSHAMPQMNAAGWPGYVHPATGVPPTGVPQPHFILPTQFWPMDMDSVRMYGSGENLFAGTTPEQSLNGVDAGEVYDIPLFNSFFDSFLPH
ncbi:MAG: hypothetical protein J3Q66DRAFT_7406 [Benniella sp.]|nr:MAG: hypothetical protein J3Q66DRAFT_7406 [Benniella sp.]